MRTKETALILMVTASFLMPANSWAQIRPRTRVSYDGILIANTIAVDADGNSRKGDILVMNIETNQGETINFAAHLYYRSPGEHNWKKVPPTSRRYRSQRLQTATAYTEAGISHGGDRAMSVFFPYRAIDLDPGRYQFRYRIRVWVDDKLVDDYDLENTVDVEVKRRFIKTTYHICPASDGPVAIPFQLQNADNPMR